MLFVTTFQSIDKTDGQIKTFVSNWCLEAISWDDAELKVKKFYPYLTIMGEYVGSCNFREPGF